MAEGFEKNSSAIARWKETRRSPIFSSSHQMWKGCRFRFFVQCNPRQSAREDTLRDKSTRFNHRIDHDVKPFSTIQSTFLILQPNHAPIALICYKASKTALTNIIWIHQMTDIQSRNNIKGVCVTRELHIKNVFRRLFANS